MIRYLEEKKLFQLDTINTTYVIGLTQEGYVGHVYYGDRLFGEAVSTLLRTEEPPFTPSKNLREKSAFLDFFPMEYPTGGIGDYRESCLDVRNEAGSKASEILYFSHVITNGKPRLEGLPASFGNDDEVQTLVITCKDLVLGLSVDLMYSVFEKEDVIVRSTHVTNEGSQTLRLEKVYSACLDMDNENFELLNLHGSWARERHIQRRELAYGKQLMSSLKGESSHQEHPFQALVTKGCDQEHGKVYAMHFVYSGNFIAQTERTQFDMVRMVMGISAEEFCWQLTPGSSFQAPEVVCVYSSEGLGKMSRSYHDFYRSHMIRSPYNHSKRPILINNWEATYFDFDEEKILGLARTAKELGIELLVLDDGWFGKRNSDTCSLGDWYVNKEKLPDGIAALAQKVNEAGVKFGLWFEPEMVSPDSDLYRAHPDWCIHIPGRERTECRNQLTLDLSRKEVCDYLIKTIGGILDQAEISYVKWDMNRHMTELGSAGLPPERQKEMPHRYMLGLYRVLEEIVSSHPDVLFESCSGGGGRFDAGMLYYMPQTWTSDDTDAVERLYIQYGTSLCYPVSAMGAHVSAVPNHQANRVTSLKMRGDVAMSGNFGYELDLMKFTEEEKEEVKKQVAVYKELREFLPFAQMYRLENPFEGNAAAWQFISEDGNQIFAVYFRILCEVNPGISRMKFTALDPDARYEIIGEDQIYYGDELMEIGLVADFWGDFQSRTWRLKKL